jgi:hypothetical protein
MAGTTFKKGDSVRQIIKPIEGTVVRPEIVNDEVQFLVKWQDVDADGNPHECQKFFTDEELELI